jgi:hypothetical protein
MHADFQELLAIRDGAPVDAMVSQHALECPECSRELTRLAALKNELRQLPSYEAPERAWASIRSQVERLPLRRPNRAPLAALAASIALAVLVLPLMHRTPVFTPPDTSVSASQLPGGDDQDGLGALMQRSQRLEAVLQVLPRRPQVELAGTSATIDELQNRIQLVDHQLSTASVDQPGPDARRLWSARVELMNSLVHVRYAEAAGNADLSEPSTNLGAI